jgi:hypothetical protein
MLDGDERWSSTRLMVVLPTADKAALHHGNEAG